MTKLRAPLTFAQAITRIAGLIGWDEAARIVGRSERAVRLWSEPDAGGTPSIAQARDLDAAYQAAGGDGAPLLDSYAFQLKLQVAGELACRRELAGAISTAAREYGEAVEHAVAVLDPSATPAQLHRALTEAEGAHVASGRLMRCLKAFLPFGAGSGAGNKGGAQ